MSDLLIKLRDYEVSSECEDAGLGMLLDDCADALRERAEEIQRLQKLADRRGQLLRMIWDGPIESLTQAEAEPPQE